MDNPTTIQNIRLFLISPSPMNPRKTFSQDEFQELRDMGYDESGNKL